MSLALISFLEFDFFSLFTFYAQYWIKIKKHNCIIQLGLRCNWYFGTIVLWEVTIGKGHRKFLHSPCFLPRNILEITTGMKHPWNVCREFLFLETFPWDFWDTSYPKDHKWHVSFVPKDKSLKALKGSEIREFLVCA